MPKSLPFHPRARPYLPILLAVFTCLPPWAMAYTLTVAKDTLQPVDGFGISATWSGGEIMQLPEPEKSRVLGMFFTDTGAAMSIIRLRVVSKQDGDFRAQADIGKWAMAKGVVRFLATVWDVPGTYLDASGRLTPARFGAYADYIAQFVKDMAAEGIPVGWIGYQNEPDNGPVAAAFTVDYNKHTVAYYHSKADLRDFTVALRKTLAANGLAVKLVGPECMGWQGSRELAATQFATAEGLQALDIIGTHDYWGAEQDAGINPVRVQLAATAQALHKKIWQTEYSRVDCLPGCPQVCRLPLVAQDPARIVSQADFNMRDGLEMVGYLYNDFFLGNASAWLYWWTHNPHKGCAMQNAFNGLAMIQADGTFFFPKRFHTLSHYTRFVRPGSYRLHTVSDGEAVSHPLAFWDPAKDQVVVVAYNNGAAAAPMTVKLAGFPAHASVQHYRTTQAAGDDVSLQESRILPPGQDYAFALAPMSISTLVFKRANAVALRGRAASGFAQRIAGGVAYRAGAGERVAIQVRDPRGRLLATAVEAHAHAGEYVWRWPGMGGGAYLIQLDFPDSGAPRRTLCLAPEP